MPLKCFWSAVEVPWKCCGSAIEVPFKCHWSVVEVPLKCKHPTASSHSHRPSPANSSNIRSIHSIRSKGGQEKTDSTISKNPPLKKIPPKNTKNVWSQVNISHTSFLQKCPGHPEVGVSKLHTQRDRHKHTQKTLPQTKNLGGFFGIGATICIGPDIQCPPYEGFLIKN